MTIEVDDGHEPSGRRYHHPWESCVQAPEVVPGKRTTALSEGFTPQSHAST